MDNKFTSWCIVRAGLIVGRHLKLLASLVIGYASRLELMLS